MSGISSVDAATHLATEFISALKNPAPAAPFATLVTEKLNAIRKFSEKIQGQITSKTKL